MPFCSNCGAPVNDAVRFCGNCGAPRQVAQVPMPPPPRPPRFDCYQQSYTPPSSAYPPEPEAQAGGPSQIIAVLPQARKMKLMGLYDSYTLVFTERQFIVARLSNDVLKDVVKQSQAKSKAEGKGWMGIVGDQMRAFGNAQQRYFAMTPGQILAETPGNFAIDHTLVSSVKVKSGFEGGDEDRPGTEYTDVEFETPGGKYKYRLSMSPGEVVALLNNFFAGRIKR